MSQPGTVRELDKIMQDNALIRDRIPAHWAVYAVSQNAGLDVNETLSAIEFCKSTGEIAGGDEDSYKTLAQLLSKPTEIRACPVTGQALRNGKTVRAPYVDWNGISDELQQAACYAARHKNLPRSAESAEKTVYELRQLPLPPPWPRTLKEWIALRDEKQKTPEQAAIVAGVLSALKFNKGGAQEPRPFEAKEQAESIVIAPSASVIPSTSTGPFPPVPSTGLFPPVPGAGPIKILFIYASEDARYMQGLKKHLYFAIKAGTIEVLDPATVPVGANVISTVSSWANTADVILYGVSTDLFSCSLWDELARNLKQIYPQKRHVPFILRPVVNTGGGILSGAPLNEKPMSSVNNQDEAYTEACGHILRLVKEVKALEGIARRR